MKEEKNGEKGEVDGQMPQVGILIDPEMGLFYKTALLFEINPRADLFKSETCHTFTCCTVSGSEVRTVG